MADFPIKRWKQVADLHGGVARVQFEASEAERVALAALFGVDAVDALAADFEMRPWRSVGLAVDGHVEGAVQQACVVTLEPVKQAVRETVAVRLMPAGAAGEGADAREVTFDPLEGDPPEPFEGGRVDLGAIAAEHFALGIDPYPRKPGVAFDPAAAGLPPEAEAPEETPSPFAALSALRAKGDKA